MMTSHKRLELLALSDEAAAANPLSPLLRNHCHLILVHPANAGGSIAGAASSQMD